MLFENIQDILKMFNDLTEIYEILFGDDLGIEFLENYFDSFPIELQKRTLKIIYNFVSDYIGFDADAKMAIDYLDIPDIDVTEDADVMDTSDEVATAPKRIMNQYRNMKQILKDPEKMKKFIYSFDSQDFLPRDKVLNDKTLSQIKNKLTIIKNKMGEI